MLVLVLVLVRVRVRVLVLRLLGLRCSRPASRSLRVPCLVGFNKLGHLHVYLAVAERVVVQCADHHFRHSRIGVLAVGKAFGFACTQHETDH